MQYLIALTFVAAISAISCTSDDNPTVAPENSDRQVNSQGAASVEQPAPVSKTIKAEIVKNSNVFQVLLQNGIDAQTAHEIISAAKPEFNLASVQVGMKLEIDLDTNKQASEMRMAIGSITTLKVSKSNGQWTAITEKAPTTTKLVSFEGVVEGSLWGSAMAAKLPAYLTVSLSEIFSWEIDFYRQIRKGDRWKISAEEIFSGDKHVGWGKVLYAEYINQGELHTAYYFESSDQTMYGHFDGAGKSLRRTFLKSPLKFGRITSKFSLRRFHPIKKVYRPHRGVDYGAPTGTPIRSIGNGTIRKIGRFGAAGKLIMIQHPGNYKTRYLHLSRYARDMRVGTRVKQGQVIGYVGRTGAATGPHLHFEMYKNGRFIDPLKVKMPPSKAIPPKILAEFQDNVKVIDRLLDASSDKPTYAFPYKLDERATSPDEHINPLSTIF